MIVHLIKSAFIGLTVIIPIILKFIRKINIITLKILIVNHLLLIVFSFALVQVNLVIYM